jgi:hypothetical protein
MRSVLEFFLKNKNFRRATMKAVVRVLSALVFTLSMFAIPSTSFSAEKVYKEGTVWEITYVRTMPGMFDKYMENLSHMWKGQMDTAIKKGYVLSYNIVSKAPANPKDWDLMLMVQYKNMAALDGLDDKMETAAKEATGDTSDQMTQKTVERGALREILGTVLTREQKFK